jgi:hypothetical protein
MDEVLSDSQQQAEVVNEQLTQSNHRISNDFRSSDGSIKI